MTLSQQQEQISRAYVYAIAARCGFNVARWDVDQDGIDLTIGASRIGKPRVDFQLKTSRQSVREHGEHFSVQLTSTGGVTGQMKYDRLRAEPAQSTVYAVLLVLPEEVASSVEHTVEHLLIRKCAYWLKATGLPAVTAQNPTLKFPKNQIFSPDTLLSMLDQEARRLTPAGGAQ